MTETLVPNNDADVLGEAIRQAKENADHVYDLYKQMKQMKDEVGQSLNGFRTDLDQAKTMWHQIQDTTVINGRQDHKLTKAISLVSSNLALKWIENHHDYKEYGGGDYRMKKIAQMRMAIYRVFKDRFNISTRRDLRAKDFNDAMSFVFKLHLYNLDAWRIIDRQTTLTTLNKWEKNHDLPITKPTDY